MKFLISPNTSDKNIIQKKSFKMNYINDLKVFKSSRDVYIVGGGTSISNIDLNSIPGDIIAVNKSIEFVKRANYFITVDYSFIQNKKCDLGELSKASCKIFVANMSSNVLQKINNVYTDVRNNNKYDLSLFTNVIESKNIVDNKTGFGTTIETFTNGLNSGYCALQLALLLNYDNIYLLGIDLNFSGNILHFHNSYKTQSPEKFKTDLEKYLSCFLQSIEKLDSKTKSKIISCSAISSLNSVLQYKNIDKQKQMNKSNFTVVGYYTVNTPYEKEKEILVKSCEKFNIKYFLKPVESFGSWQKNTQYKVNFLKECLEQFKGERLVYVDCDAEFLKYPLDLYTLNCDISVRWETFRRGITECLSGTIYFESNDRVRNLFNLWEYYNDLYPNIFEQENLGKALKTLQERNNIIYTLLPPEYCFVFDHHKKLYPNIEPIIEHHQKSREFKKIVNT